MKRKLGAWLLVMAYAIFLYIAISAPAFAAYAHQHPGMQTLPEYSKPWPSSLMGSIGITGLVLTLIPIRRGERWAMFTSLATFAILFITRMATDPRCLVVLDPHQHGCHTFIIAVAFGVAGLILAAF